MARVPPPIREFAETVKDALRTGAAAAAVAVASSAASGMRSSAEKGIALLGALMTALALTAEALANDPPRRDFEVRVRPGARPLRLQLLPDDPVAGDVRECATWLARSDALVGAALRAFERECGAADAGEEAAADRRRAERIRYAREAAKALRLTAAALERVADVVAWSAPRRGQEPAVGLSESLLAWLYRVGVRLGTTERFLEVASARAAAVADAGARRDAVRNGAASLRALAEALERWDAGPGTTPPPRGPVGPRNPHQQRLPLVEDW